MPSKSEIKVFCFLRAVECLISLACGIIHIVGFNDPKEPTMHQVIFWGSFFAFVSISSHGIFQILYHGLNLKTEAATAMLGSIVFTATAILSMYNVEHDPHLTKFKDHDEFFHRYFRMSRLQSIASLVNAFVVLMHSTFVIDVILTQPMDETNIEEAGNNHRKPLQLLFFPEKIIRAACRWLKSKFKLNK